MPCPSIDYLNARRALKAASGGTNYAAESDAERDRRHVNERAADRDLDPVILACERSRSMLADFGIWAECTRQALCEKLGIPSETADDIPF